MKIRIRLILLLSLIILLFFTAFAVSRNFDKRTLVILFQNEAVNMERNFDKLILLKCKSLETLAFDYTYWDEMTAFVQSADMEWAKANLDTCLSTYEANAVWVYKPDLSLVYSTNNLDEGSLKEIPIPKEAIKKKLFAKENRFCHFFVDTEKGIMEIRGATIHPSEDNKRKTMPQGYFLAGRLWSQNYISELSELSNSTITINPIMHSSDPQKGEISFQRLLMDYNDAVLKKINVISISNVIADFNHRSKKYFFALTLFIFIIIGVFSVFIIKWVGIPVYLISKTLKKEDTAFIEQLENTKTEFGDIARLIKNFFKQKFELIKEITERKKIEGALRTSKQCFHNIVELSTDGIIIVDKAMLVRFINPAAEFFLGNKNLLDKAFNFLILVKEVSEISIIRRNGENGFGEMRAAETTWDAAPAYLITIQDITPRKEIQKNQRLAQLGKLAADMAHEVNNPLMIISGNAQITLLEQIDNPTIKNNLDIIYEQSLRAKDIVQRLLKFSRPSREERKNEDINKLLAEVILMVQHQFKLSGIEIKTNYISNAPFVWADSHQIQEVFINLLNNAKDAFSAGGIIEISTSLENKLLRIDFRDTGCGIHEKDLEKILEPFFTTKAHGTGLGLPLCYSIITAHNGKIKLTSKPGKGTTVTILLPVMEEKDNA